MLQFFVEQRFAAGSALASSDLLATWLLAGTGQLCKNVTLDCRFIVVEQQLVSNIN